MPLSFKVVRRLTPSETGVVSIHFMHKDLNLAVKCAHHYGNCALILREAELRLVDFSKDDESGVVTITHQDLEIEKYIETSRDNYLAWSRKEIFPIDQRLLFAQRAAMVASDIDDLVKEIRGYTAALNPSLPNS